jgi:KDO2-lipid IV(A) lauroyltransferase
MPPPQHTRLYLFFRSRVRPPLLAALLHGLSWGLGRTSWAAAQRCGRLLGGVSWWLGRRDRRRALAHVAIAFPALAARERRAIARACFAHQGMNLAECLYLLRRDCAALAQVVDFDGWEEVEAVLAARRPLVMISAHCGNWELLGPAFACRGVPVVGPARPVEAAALQRLLADFRESFGTRALNRNSLGSSRELLGALRQGRVLGMFIDQDTLKAESVWVPFFGRPARTPVGALKIALHQEAVVLAAFIERRSDGRHQIRILPPCELPAEPRAATALLTAEIEQQVRRCPEQWVWMHRRWRTPPPPSGATPADLAAAAGAPAATAVAPATIVTVPAGVPAGMSAAPLAAPPAAAHLAPPPTGSPQPL